MILEFKNTPLFAGKVPVPALMTSGTGTSTIVIPYMKYVRESKLRQKVWQSLWDAGVHEWAPAAEQWWLERHQEVEVNYPLSPCGGEETPNEMGEYD